jgi:hypothetical protein
VFNQNDESVRFTFDLTKPLSAPENEAACAAVYQLLGMSILRWYEITCDRCGNAATTKATTQTQTGKRVRQVG